jgi:hypothetical protein
MMSHKTTRRKLVSFSLRTFYLALDDEDEIPEEKE